MKIRNLLLALAVVAVAPATAQAQASDTYVLDIAGVIASNVTATPQGSMSFGTITATGETSIGQFSVSANQETTVSIVVSSLTNGTASIGLTAACAYGTDFDTGTPFTGGLCAATTLSAGANEVWVQGTVDDLSNATLAGEYTGTATLTVSYTSF